MELTLKDKADIYRNWLSSRSVGDTVEVQHPWDDSEFYSGARSPGVVKEAREVDLLVTYARNGTEYTKLFSKSFGRESPYAQLAPADVEVCHSWEIGGYYVTLEPPRRRKLALIV
jgi:hypothetical protein